MTLKATGRAGMLSLLALLAAQPRVVTGHGRLTDPPARSSMWRYGYDTPVNNDDTALFCGGWSVLWERNRGRCGVCGDPYNGPRPHEAGGKYANGIIVRHYREGETIAVSVELTTSHLGYFEFRICPHNDPSTPVTQDCLDRCLLQQPDGATKYPITSPLQGVRHVQLVLPPGLTCTQCVLQWKYTTGHFWGCDGVGPTQTCCLGCGRQENYYGCADVDVTSSSGNAGTLQATGHPAVTYSTPLYNTPTNGFPTVSTPTENTFIHNTPAFGIPIPNTPASLPYTPAETQTSPPYYTRCRGLDGSMTEYCRAQCLVGYCSRMLCTEDCQWLAFLRDPPQEDVDSADVVLAMDE